MAFRSSIMRLVGFGKFFRQSNATLRRKLHQGRRWSRFYPHVARNANLNGVVVGRRTFRMLVLTNDQDAERGLDEIGGSFAGTGGGTSFFNGTCEPFLILVRIVVITLVVTGLAVAYLMTQTTGGQAFPKILRRGIEFLGPIFIKFGQWICTRPDIFPEDICCGLSKLQHNVSPHSWTYTKSLLKATYGPAWRELFMKFDDETPIGSGCCAQVYKAWIDLDAHVEMTRETRVSRFVEIMERLNLSCILRMFDRALGNCNEFNVPNPGDKRLQPVAVKVLHPGIEGQLKRDLIIIRAICKCATYIVPDLHWLSLTECIDEFSRIMENQIDMRVEAANLVQFSRNFSEKNEVAFPHAYGNFTHRSILVESFHEGPPISDYLDHDNAEFQRKLARIGITTVLKMVFEDNFIHCDLHPGNILVEERNETDFGLFSSFWKRVAPKSMINNPRLIILDCGLTVSLNNRCRRNLYNVFRSVLLGDGESAAEYMLQHSSHMTPDPDGFKTTIGEIVTGHLKSPTSVNVSTVVTELFSAMVRHRVKQDGSFSSVILSMVVIEGLGRSLDPDIDIFTEVLPFILTRSVYDN